MSRFENAMVEAVYLASLDGPDAEAGGLSEYGTWYGLMRGPFFYYSADEWGEGVELTPEERAELDRYAGAILVEDQYGFVGAEFFETTEALDARWAEIEDSLSTDSED